MLHHEGRPSRFHIRAQDQPVVDQGDAADETWMAAGGDPRDQGRLVELVSQDLVGSERLMVGLAWLRPGEVHLLHHHPHADEWYYVIRGSAQFTIGDEVVRGSPGSALWIPTGTPHGIHNDDPDETVEFLWGFDKPRLDAVGIVWDA
ncbi:cupin domain-containing protein [Pseudonocardia sp. KRD291]|uniref:cupin domain-containing protein n=1 Tax=Pseudonocardia sp. KRD291 TaxID=2792007 RepID=UPI001C4A73AE|nr:cupin domain-containing protein [Pseudonocardia sp. KRD291]MBW0101758.1 cupin domain-containing protein [Pseudonocardia sp. KRD291]